jgi:hypothetical protein
LEPILEQHPADEPSGRDGEAALMEGHEEHHEPLGGGRGIDSSPGTFDSTVAVSGGSWPASTRRRSCSREMLERVQFNITAAESMAGWKRKK